MATELNVFLLSPNQLGALENAVSEISVSSLLSILSVSKPLSPTDLPSTLDFATHQSLQGGEKQGSVS